MNTAWFAACALFALGLGGLLSARTLLNAVIALQVLGKSVVLALAAAGASSGQPALGQSLALTALAADTVLTMLALALAVQIKRQCGTLDWHALSNWQKG